MFHAIHTIYLCAWSVKVGWTVRAFTLDWRLFNIPECCAHVHFYGRNLVKLPECVILGNKLLLLPIVTMLPLKLGSHSFIFICFSLFCLRLHFSRKCLVVLCSCHLKYLGVKVVVLMYFKLFISVKTFEDMWLHM